MSILNSIMSIFTTKSVSAPPVDPSAQYRYDIERVLATFVNGQKAFTAWDISQGLEQGAAYVPHHIVRAAVTAAFKLGEMPGYEMKVLSVKDDGTTAKVYFPAGTDPMAYPAAAAAQAALDARWNALTSFGNDDDEDQDTGDANNPALDGHPPVGLDGTADAGRDAWSSI